MIFFSLVFLLNIFKIASSMEFIKQSLQTVGVTLHDYQEEGVGWCLNSEHVEGPIERCVYGGLLCDEMGLGKTLQMISVMIGNPLPDTLIVCPASLIEQWASEFKKFAPNIRTIVYCKHNVLFKGTKEAPNAFIVSYATFLRNKSVFNSKSWNWDRIICDEIHYIRNHKSKCFKAILTIKAINRWGLTGTPIQNYKSDLIALFNFLGFAKDYIKGNFEVLVSKYLLRRTKGEVGINIPRLHKSELFVRQTIEEEELYTTIERNNDLVLENESIPLDFETLVKILRLRQCSISPKMIYKALKTEDDMPISVEWEANISRLEKVIEIARENNKLVIFCEFTDEINYLFNEIKEFGAVTILNGKKKREEKKRILENLESYDYLIVQIKCGSTGLNLQYFNKAIITGPHYNPMLEEQAIARIHRIGQDSETKLFRLYNEFTIDSRIREIQEKKRDLIRKYI